MKLRQAQKEDYVKILDFCHRNNKRTPSESGTLIIAEQGEDIVGVANCVLKPFIDPMVVDMGKSVVERVRIIEALLHTVRGVFMVGNCTNVYFTAEGDGFLKFLENRFDIEKFTNESTFIAKV